MKKLLFIHGYDTTAEESGMMRRIKNVFGDEYEVRGINYSQTDPVAGIKTIRDFYFDWRPNLVIGSSLGGFFALQLGGQAKTVVFNPCLCPSKELGKLGMEHPEVYEPLEKEFIEDPDDEFHDVEARATTMAVFGFKDELFSYKDLYKKLFGFGKSDFEMNCGHRVPEEVLRNLKPAILAWANKDVGRSFSMSFSWLDDD